MAKYTYHKGLGKATYQQMLNKEVFIFLYMEISYINLATKTNRIYKCEMKISPMFPKPLAYVEFLYNENEDEK